MTKKKDSRKKQKLDAYQDLSRHLTDSASKIYITIAEEADELSANIRQQVDVGDVSNFENKVRDSIKRISSFLQMLPKLQELENSLPTPSE